MKIKARGHTHINTHSLTRFKNLRPHKLINSLTHKLINIQTHQPSNSRTHKLINSSTHELTNSQAHQLTNSSTHQLINSSTYQLTTSPTHELISPPTYQLTTLKVYNYSKAVLHLAFGPLRQVLKIIFTTFFGFIRVDCTYFLLYRALFAIRLKE